MLRDVTPYALRAAGGRGVVELMARAKGWRQDLRPLENLGTVGSGLWGRKPKCGQGFYLIDCWDGIKRAGNRDRTRGVDNTWAQ
jgi:hypothetical protein